jgi:hypothetical protein
MSTLSLEPVERRQLEAYIRVRQAMGKNVRDLFAAA